MTKILAFSPYARWSLHSNYEVAILTACRERGADIRVVLCNGQFSECDLHNGPRAGTLRPLSFCDSCQSEAKAVFEGAGIAYEWFGPYLTAEGRREALDWANGLRPEEFANASFRGQPIGPWVTSSVVTYWRRYPLPLDDWNTINVYRGFLHAGAIAFLGLSALLDHVKPDAMLLFNARFSVMRVAYKLARGAGDTHALPRSRP